MLEQYERVNAEMLKNYRAGTGVTFRVSRVGIRRRERIGDERIREGRIGECLIE